MRDDNQDHGHERETDRDDVMVTVWYDDLVDEGTERRYPYTATLVETVEYVPPEQDRGDWFGYYGDFLREGARLVGGALPVGAFPPDTFDPARNSDGRQHGDVCFVGFARCPRARAFHPRVTDAGDDLVVVAETTVATVPVISDNPTEVGK